MRAYFWARHMLRKHAPLHPRGGGAARRVWLYMRAPSYSYIYICAYIYKVQPHRDSSWGLQVRTFFASCAADSCLRDYTSKGLSLYIKIPSCVSHSPPASARARSILYAPKDPLANVYMTCVAAQGSMHQWNSLCHPAAS